MNGNVFILIIPLLRLNKDNVKSIFNIFFIKLVMNSGITENILFLYRSFKYCRAIILDQVSSY